MRSPLMVAGGAVLAVALLLLGWSEMQERALRDCILSSAEGQRVPTVAGESTLRVDVVDLVIYRKVSTRYAGGRDADIDARIDACRTVA